MTDATRARRRTAIAAVLLAAAAMLSSSPVWALCPNCLAQSPTLTPTLRLLGLFLLVPFVVALVVTRIIRRACRDAEGTDPAVRPTGGR